MVNDPHASRHHLQIIQHGDGHFSLFDFGSTNGTYVNGQKIKGEILLKPTDIVRIGNTAIPWVSHFPYCVEGQPAYDFEKNASNNDQQDVKPSPSTEVDTQEERASGTSVGLVISIIISLVMIIGGLAEKLVLRGTNSSIALVVVGAALLVIDVIKLIKR